MEPSCPCSIRVMNNAIPGTGWVLRVLTNKINILPTFVKHLLQTLTHNFFLDGGGGWGGGGVLGLWEGGWGVGVV